MPRIKSSFRLSLFKTEKTKWKKASKRHKMTLSQFIRMVMNSRLHIPTNDLAKKTECRNDEQMSIYDEAKM